eukprot:m51a1_g14611 hypothetical protein (198) ;mRNA; r:1207749-1208434
MRAPQALVLSLLAIGSCAGTVPHWGGCSSTADCDPTPVQGKPVCCHVGDRRCLTMDDCDWVNWIEKAPEPRNCDCIAERGGSAKRWDSCKLSSECDPGLTTDKKRLCCPVGDSRCLTKDDCDDNTWAHCYNGIWDPSEYETDIDCGHTCFRKCAAGEHCELHEDCAGMYCRWPYRDCPEEPDFDWLVAYRIGRGWCV